MFISKLILFLFLNNIYTQNINIEIEGTATIEGSLSNSRNEAKKEAFINAIRATLINISKNATLIKNIEYELNKTIYSQVENYIDSFRVLSELRTQNILKITYSININTNKLRNDLVKYGIGFDNKKIPKLIPFIAEKIADDTILLNSLYSNKTNFTDIETNLSNNLLNKGYILINPYELEFAFPSSNIFLFLKINDLKDYAKKYDADLICTGYVYTSCTKDINIKCNTLISLQILTKDGNLLSSRKVNTSFSSEDYDNSYRLSREQSLKNISDIIAIDLENYLQAKNNIFYNITFNNLNTYEQYINIKKAFDSQDLQGLASITERYQSKGTIEFTVQVNNTNVENSKNIITNKLKEHLNFNIMEFKDENIILNII